MKKLKKLWKNNKFAIVLCTILLVCVCAIGYVAFTYFFGGSDSVYGDRLDGIEDYEITDSIEEELISSIESEEIVNTASLSVSGKIVYISINFVEDTSLTDAQKLAVTSLDLIDGDILSYYDLNYIIYYETDSVLMGYKNASNSIIVWNNNTAYEVEEESE